MNVISKINTRHAADQEMPPIHVFIIAYSKEIAAAIEPGYLLLDNIDNVRADWREYWPIRNYLLNHELDEDSYYGFFSPRFREKTGISYNQLITYIRENAKGADACTFSPQVDIGAFFQNVFYGGELMSPGFLDASQRVFDRNNVDVSLGSLFMDTRTTVFSNYIVARPSYWREWLKIGEMVFAAAECEDVHDELRIKLTEPTTYPGAVERKVFVVEALASLVLNLRKDLRIHAYDPFSLSWSAQLGQFKQEAIVCDSLKTAMIEQGRSTFSRTFRQISSETLKKANLLRPDPYMLNEPVYDQFNDTLLDLIPAGLQRVVEVGCKRGTLAKEYLVKNSGCKWIGIDHDIDHIQAAKAICHKVLCENVETMSDEALLQFVDVDAWVFGDVLERLIDPWALLGRVKKIMRPGACIVVSIPNAQHWSVQARLSAGKLRYEDNTTFDRTIIRMFTRLTIIEMLNTAGFKIEEGVSRSRNHPDVTKYVPPIRAMAEANGHDPDLAVSDAMTFQFVMRAVPV
jgi:SAM-dependent methyltransferase